MRGQQLVAEDTIACSIDQLGQAALVLVGHGSTCDAEAGKVVTQDLAEMLRRRNLFAEVVACFWKGTPSLREIMALVTASEVFVVPNFSGVGYLTHEAIPREMGLSGSLTKIVGMRGTVVRRIHYTAPVGAHPWLALLIRRRVETVIRCHNLTNTGLCLLLIGHGSRRSSGNASETAELLATALRRYGRIGTVRTAYLEQDPLVTEWPSFVPEPNILVIPLLISEGLRSSQNLPPLFGLNQTTADRLSATGPIPIHGRQVWYYHRIGSDLDDITDIVLDHVLQALNTCFSRQQVPTHPEEKE